MTGKIRSMIEKVEKVKAIEFAVVLSLLCVIGKLYYDNDKFLYLSAGVMLVSLIYPAFFKPPAALWYGLSKVLGFISSRIILTVVFVIVVVPVALIRRALGKDTLRLRQFKKDKKSVLSDRNHLYSSPDLKSSF